jgi:D-3-phosphoglycerate dehydrogenase
MHKILLVDDFHSDLMQGLSQKGIAFDYLPNFAEADIRGAISGYTGLLIRSKMRVDQSLLERAPVLQFIGRGGAGLDNIDEAACNKRDIALFNAGGANADAVGEQTLAMLLSLFTRLHKADAEVRKGLWDREGNRGLELAGRTVGIVGYGNTGSAVARKLAGFGVRVLVYDKYKEVPSEGYIQAADRVKIVSESDILSFHVPLTVETRNWVDDAFVMALSKPIWLLNLSRGEVVDTQAVWRGIQSGKILGFGADVLEREPPMKEGSSIRELMLEMTKDYRCLFAPHIGGWTTESYQKISLELLSKTLAFIGVE